MSNREMEKIIEMSKNVRGYRHSWMSTRDMVTSCINAAVSTIASIKIIMYGDPVLYKAVLITGIIALESYIMIIAEIIGRIRDIRENDESVKISV